jgi:hypothetical protein
MLYTKYFVRNATDRFMLVQQKYHNKTELDDITHNRYIVMAKHFDIIAALTLLWHHKDTDYY